MGTQIREQAVEVLHELVGAKAQLDELEQVWAPLQAAGAGGLWSSVEWQLLLSPAGELPRSVTLQECAALLERSVHLCREVAGRVAAHSSERSILPSGTPAPRALVELAQRVGGSNLPYDEDSLVVEVVRQAFLSSLPPQSTGVPALRGYTDPTRPNQVLGLEAVHIPQQRTTSPAGARTQTKVPMNSMLITYAGRRPQRVHKEISALRARWCRVAKRTWIVRTPLEVADLHRILRVRAGKRCRLLVVELGNDASWQNLSPAVHTWMNSNV